MWLQGGVCDAETGDLESCRSTYALAEPRIQNAREQLIELGVYEAVNSAVIRSLELVLGGQFVDAQRLLARTGRQLRESSGSNDALRRRYNLDPGSD